MPKFVTSLTFSSSGEVLTGDSNGRIVVWQSDHQEAYVYNHRLSEPMRAAHQVNLCTGAMVSNGAAKCTILFSLLMVVQPIFGLLRFHS